MWIWDEEGNNGKTWMAQHLFSLGAIYLDTTKRADVAQIISTSTPTDTYVFNITRKHEDFFNYGTLEAIKDGLLCSPKYESKTISLETPNRVFIFANFTPDRSQMSSDRWEVHKLISL